MSVIEVTNDTFEAEVLQSDRPVLVDFNADWCGPCRMLRPILDEIAAERQNVTIASVNVDDAEELAEAFGVSSIPCLVLMKNGQEVDRVIGLRSKDDLLALLD